jgi:hypothetical protein
VLYYVVILARAALITALLWVLSRWDKLRRDPLIGVEFTNGDQPGVRMRKGGDCSTVANQAKQQLPF